MLPTNYPLVALDRPSLIGTIEPPVAKNKMLGWDLVEPMNAAPYLDDACGPEVDGTPGRLECVAIPG